MFLEIKEIGSKLRTFDEQIEMGPQSPSEDGEVEVLEARIRGSAARGE